MTEKNKSIFDKVVDGLTNRDEKEELEKATMAAEAASKEAAGLRAKMADDKTTTDVAKVASEKAAAEAAKIAADKAAADKVAAERAAAAAKVLQERTAAALAAQPKKGIVTTRSLRVRKDHDTSAVVVEGLDEGAEVQILETWTDGKNTWAKIGTDKWAAMIYDGQTLMKYA